VVWKRSNIAARAAVYSETIQQQQHAMNDKISGNMTNEVHNSRPKRIYDQIVVGAGITGLWIAHQLSRAGQRVLILDQVLIHVP
jgi:ribulose 1,5-bisphosphate synthetase/thiazole synthase